MRGDLAYIQSKAKLLFASTKRPCSLPYLFSLTDAARGQSTQQLLHYAPKESAVIIRTFGNDGLIAKATKDRNLKTLATTSPCTAHIYGLDGVHFPNNRLKYYKKSEPYPKLVTASAHNLRELLRAKNLGITNIMFSTIFTSDSKSANKRPIGPIKLAKLARDFPKMNFIALGGINRKTLLRLKNTNIKAIAGVSFS